MGHWGHTEYQGQNTSHNPATTVWDIGDIQNTRVKTLPTTQPLEYGTLRTYRTPGSKHFPQPSHYSMGHWGYTEYQGQNTSRIPTSIHSVRQISFLGTLHLYIQYDRSALLAPYTYTFSTTDQLSWYPTPIHSVRQISFLGTLHLYIQYDRSALLAPDIYTFSMTDHLSWHSTSIHSVRQISFLGTLHLYIQYDRSAFLALYIYTFSTLQLNI